MEAPDLLILDYRLGDYEGPDLLPALESTWSRAVPVVIVSGEHVAMLRQALRNKPWPVLAKPVRPEELRAGLLAMLTLTAADS
jgi:histidine kinase